MSDDALVCAEEPVSEVLVSCRRASRTYGSGSAAVVAVHDVSCEIVPAMRLALSGPSGSGKSTLLHLMAGLETTTAGEVSWPALGAHPNRPGGIGVVFQGPSLLPSLDVVENVALPLVLAGLDDGPAHDRAHATLVRLRIDDLARKLPDELSGGQAQRVAVARAISVRPRVILADEPTGQLDHDTAHRVISVLLEAADHSGAALVVTTHDPQVSARLGAEWRVRDGALLPGTRAVS